MEIASNESPQDRWAGLAALVIGAALLAAPLFGHFDDTDAQLYQVVIRNIVSRRAWFDLGYLDHLYPHFREHLPFGFWPFALAVAAFGEGAGRIVGAIFSFATLAGLLIAGRRLLGPWPATLAVVVLSTTETFFRYGATTRLDPVLMLVSNAAAVPILLGPESSRAWPGAITAASIATLVKGPFGLVPFSAAAISCAWARRSWKLLFRGVSGILLASIPLVAFLSIDRFSWHEGWWDVYLRLQILGSAAGARADGSTLLWYPFSSVIGRFWPGLPLLACTLVLLLRGRAGPRVAQLALFCLCMLLILCLPGRKVWNHELIAYPGLALLAGASAAPLRGWLDEHAPTVARSLMLVAAATVIATPWIGHLVNRRPCVGSSEFARILDTLPPGASILVVSRPTSWATLASLSAERRLEPEPVEALVDSGDTTASLALVESMLAPRPLPDRWERISAARDWILLRRRD